MPCLLDPIHLALVLALFDRLALVVLTLADGEGKLHLRPALLEVNHRRDQRHPFLDNLELQLADLGFVQQQQPLGGRLMTSAASLVVRRDVQCPQDHSAAIDHRVSILKAAMPGAEGLHLAAGQRNAALDLRDKLVLERGFLIAANYFIFFVVHFLFLPSLTVSDGKFNVSTADPPWSEGWKRILFLTASRGGLAVG